MNSIYFSLIISFFTFNCSPTPETSTNGVNEIAVEVSQIKAPEAALAIEKTVENLKLEAEETTPIDQITVKEEEVVKVNSNPRKPSERISNEEVSITSEGKITKVIEILKPDHTPFDQMLQANVSSKGVVNYQNWKNDLSKLDEYLTDLAANEPESSWSRFEKLAYWINLYNAATVKLILDNYPVKSIMDIDGGKPWDRKWIKVGSNTYSLNQIENDIIRPRFGDGRIHFAVNCAAKSCPPLYNRAFTASNLNSSLATLSRKFINNTAFNRISKNQLQLSNIFNWYASDFGDLKTFISKYTDVEIKDNAKISYLEYNWALNGQ